VTTILTTACWSLGLAVLVVMAGLPWLELFDAARVRR